MKVDSSGVAPLWKEIQFGSCKWLLEVKLYLFYAYADSDLHKVVEIWRTNFCSQVFSIVTFFGCIVESSAVSEGVCVRVTGKENEQNPGGITISWYHLLHKSVHYGEQLLISKWRQPSNAISLNSCQRCCCMNWQADVSPVYYHSVLPQ